MVRIVVAIALVLFAGVGVLSGAMAEWPAEVARLDRRVDVLSFSVWGSDFSSKLQEFDRDLPRQSPRHELHNVAHFAVKPIRGERYDFTALIRDGKSTLPWTVLVFHSEHCGPCRNLLTKSLVPLSAKNWSTGQYGEPAHFQLVNADQHEDLCSRFRVHQVPTLVIVKDGKEVARRTGFVDEKQLAAWVNSHVAPKPQYQQPTGGRWRRW